MGLLGWSIFARFIKLRLRLRAGDWLVNRVDSIYHFEKAFVDLTPVQISLIELTLLVILLDMENKRGTAKNAVGEGYVIMESERVSTRNAADQESVNTESESILQRMLRINELRTWKTKACM